MNTGRPDENYPDISGLFKIDEAEIPTDIIKKTVPAKKSGESILNPDTALKELPKHERKAIRKDKTTAKRNNFILRSRKKMLLAAVCTVIALVAIFIAGFVITQSRKPVVSYEKPVIQTISIHSDDIGISYPVNNEMNVVFVDNEYDINFIEVGQRVEMTTAKSLTEYGTITAIKEESPESELITKYYQVLTTDMPSTSVYTVYVKPDSGEILTSAGTVVSIKVLTTTSEDAMTVPSIAVHEDENGMTYVWTYSFFSRSVSRTDVTTGITSDGRTEILTGLKKSSRVIYSFSCPSEEIHEDMKVRTK